MGDRSESLTELIPALIAAQRVMKPALKSTQGQRGKYVNLESAWDACKEALWDHGLAVIQTTRVGDGGDSRLVTTLAHTSGQFVSGEYPLRPAKADDPQALGATVTYARRYALMAAVGLAPEDDDGETASRPAARTQQDRSTRQGDEGRKAVKDQFKPQATGETWPEFLNRMVRTANDNWANEQAQARIPEGGRKKLATPDQVINKVLTLAVQNGVIKEDDIAPAGVRDKDAARAAVLDLYARDRVRVRATVEQYLGDKLKALCDRLDKQQAAEPALAN